LRCNFLTRLARADQDEDWRGNVKQGNDEEDCRDFEDRFVIARSQPPHPQHHSADESYNRYNTAYASKRGTCKKLAQTRKRRWSRSLSRLLLLDDRIDVGNQTGKFDDSADYHYW
jgi:hypothetical protein